MVWLLPMSAARSGQRQASCRSRPRSKTFTEWVSAPTEMKSTPVAATSRARSRVRPPEASRVARPAVIRDRLGHRRDVHVVEQDLGAARVEELAQLVEVGDLDLDPQVGVGGPDGLVGRDHAAGGDHVVVLDHRPVGEAEAVVDAAAAAHGVLLQARGRSAASCGCRAPAPGCRRARATQAAVAVATPERCEAKFSAVRSAVSSPRPGPDRASRRRPAPTRVPSATRSATDRRRPARSRRRARRRRGPATTPASRAAKSPVAAAVARHRPRWWRRRPRRAGPRRRPGRPSRGPRAGRGPPAASSATRAAAGRRTTSGRSHAGPRPSPAPATNARVVVPVGHHRVEVTREAGVVALGEVLAPVRAPGLLAQRRGVGQGDAEGDQVGGLPRLLVERPRSATPASLSRSAIAVAEPGRRCAARRRARSSPPAAPGAPTPATRPSVRVSGAGSASGRSSPGSTVAIRREKTRPSSSELEARRLAPCTPEQATSPVA